MVKIFNRQIILEEELMEKSQMKNIVVLKNLPSNLIEGAFVIVKSNKIAKQLEYVDKKEKAEKTTQKTNDYIIREAESVISSYISKIEKKEKKPENQKINQKYQKLKIYSIIVTIGVILLGILTMV